MDTKLIEEIISEVKPENSGAEGFQNYDTWGNPERSNKYHQLKYHIIDKGFNSFSHGGELYLVAFRHARDSRGGMDMGSPNTVEVRLANTYIV